MSRESARGRQTVPTQLAAMAAGVKESTIRKWASRGKIARYGSPGRAEYDLAELMAIATEAVMEEEGDHAESRDPAPSAGYAAEGCP
ncbi:MAG TPA: hypothetical protein VJT49_04820 [Amycolatopsis sp.]|uniref:hypothetical protein n=1 Tax=Amycolatopsis sp. TaxID=37632 RepID=UPI002B471843|nr:hypothetical protein [Amycolatopsis sp.]HKS44431.1 hypothetical protein [Amycolatopsis sp.]